MAGVEEIHTSKEERDMSEQELADRKRLMIQIWGDLSIVDEIEAEQEMDSQGSSEEER